MRLHPRPLARTASFACTGDTPRLPLTLSRILATTVVLCAVLGGVGLLGCLFPFVAHAADAATLSASGSVRHSYLALGSRTVIIDEQDAVVWESKAGSRDGFVLPRSGNVLVAWADRVEELTRAGQTVFSYKLDPKNKEIGTTQRLYNGNTLVTELGDVPRLLEITPRGDIAVVVPLVPETTNAHMQTRMARQLRNGNYLVPHLLAFSVKEYTAEGRVVTTLRTDLDSLGGRAAENWPFTAIRLDSGNTLVSLTHGNKVVEFAPDGSVVWKVTNDDVGGRFKDPCGSQRLANGNTVVGSHGASEGVFMVELDRDKHIVWESRHPAATAVHHFQILTTNGRAEPGTPMK